MKRLNVIPKPNKIEFLGGEVRPQELEITYIEDSSLGDEAYVLTVVKSGIELRYGSPSGKFYGEQTLAQLGESCPRVRIEDKPAFKYRGFMLDTVRHIFDIEQTKKIIDAAAEVKLNRMHWHLTDDQGFRFCSDSRPEATAKGSVRPDSTFGSLDEHGEYGGYFTKEQMREIVDYCAERFITVIPEFDVPGHSSALLHAYPQLSCTGGEVDIKTHQGIFEDILCAGKDETLETVFAILSEMIDIFPSEYIHIGGDEAPKKRWQSCPDCQRRIKENSLKNEEELQGWFTNQIVGFLASKGRKAIVWNESLNSGKVDDSVTVQMWMDKKKRSYAFADKGGKVIVSDFFHYYCDYPYAMTPLIKTYNYEPIPKKLKNPQNIIGVEAPIWTEFINNFDRLCEMFFPRMTAVAETGWTDSEQRNAADFMRRFRIYTPRLERLGIKPAPPQDWNPSLISRISGSISFTRNMVMKKGQ